MSAVGTVVGTDRPFAHSSCGADFSRKCPECFRIDLLPFSSGRIATRRPTLHATGDNTHRAGAHKSNIDKVYSPRRVPSRLTKLVNISIRGFEFVYRVCYLVGIPQPQGTAMAVSKSKQRAALIDRGAAVSTASSPESEYLSAAEAAKALGVSVQTLYVYVSRKAIRSQPIAGSRQRRYWKTD